MIELLAYLGPNGQEIMDIVSRRFNVLENAPICRQHDVFGWLDSQRKQFIVCTDTISRYFPNHVPEYVQETVFHEATHVAQNCKNGGNHMVPLGVKNITLSSLQVQSLKRNVRISGMSVYNIEKEAYYLETKPKDVLFYLRKYCL
jgi:hypothetical protein